MRSRSAFVIVACAVAVVAAQTHGSRPRRAQAIPVSATAYCLDGLTKSGTPARKGIVAADPRVIPLGSLVRVDGLHPDYNGTYTVADTGRAIKGREIDIFMDSCRAARRFGRQTARVRVLRRADP